MCDQSEMAQVVRSVTDKPSTALVQLRMSLVAFPAVNPNVFTVYWQRTPKLRRQ
jgi:hypothetical protein